MSDYLPKNLGNGEMPNSKTAVYTVGVGKAAIIRSIILTNKTLSAVVVNVWVNFGAGSRHIAPFNLSLDSSFFFEHDIGVTLPAGASIEMEASVANAVDYVVSGVEST